VQKRGRRFIVLQCGQASLYVKQQIGRPPCCCSLKVDIGDSVSLAPLDLPGTSVIPAIGPIPEHCTFSSTSYDVHCLFLRHTLTCTPLSLMYVTLLVHYINRLIIFFSSAVLPHPTKAFTGSSPALRK
jgi:hypothetical protein